MKSEIETKILSDNRLAAFLSHEGHNITTINTNGSISLEVKGVGLSESIKKFYDNPQIRLFDYFRHFDLVRGMVRGARS